MEKVSFILLPLLMISPWAIISACDPPSSNSEKRDEDSESVPHMDTATEPGDTDTRDAESDSMDDTGVPEDSESAGETDEEGPIIPYCSCKKTGTEIENLSCAVELCDSAVLLEQSYSSPTIDGPLLKQTRAAVSHFGIPTNDLAPLMNGSYALMATGPALGTNHNQEMNPEQSTEDPIKPTELKAFDTVKWTMKLKAPKGAGGFQIHYIFFSTEYDEWVGTAYNDKFYIILEAKSTNKGAPTVINFTHCRFGYEGDQSCTAKLAEMGICQMGDSLCYIAINSALSECCWYDGCKDGYSTTDISGTGYSCGNQGQDSKTGDGHLYGSSTGWLVTEWPIEPEEEFRITFHIHDTSDARRDSEVIIDKFLFVGTPEPGTAPVK